METSDQENDIDDKRGWLKRDRNQNGSEKGMNLRQLRKKCEKGLLKEFE